MKNILKKIFLFITYLFFEEKILRGYTRFKLRWYNPLSYPLVILWWIGSVIYYGIKEVDFSNHFKFN